MVIVLVMYIGDEVFVNLNEIDFWIVEVLKDFMNLVIDFS